MFKNKTVEQMPMGFSKKKKEVTGDFRKNCFGRVVWEEYKLELV